MIIWGSTGFDSTGGRYDPAMDQWMSTSIINAPHYRLFHTAVWTGEEMIVWGGTISADVVTNTGGRYCVQSGPTPTPTPTPTPCTGRCSPAPRPRPTPPPRP
jgi:hypothetical protein